MTNYYIKIIRESGKDPLTNENYCEESQELEIIADNVEEAIKESYKYCTIVFRGQIRRTLVNGEDFYNEKF